MTVRILVGDCRDTLKTLPDESVQCVITSPPYYGLRDYGTAEWEGGDPGCDHRQQLGGEGATSAKQNTSAGTQTMQFRDVCGKCGARRVDSQIGLEATPDEYVAEMVAVFREVRRVLRSDGVAFLNLGDSYAGSGRGMMGDGTPSDRTGTKQGTNAGTVASFPAVTTNLKPKDLIGIPWRVALALQADGVADYKAMQVVERVRGRILDAYDGGIIPDRVLYTLDNLRQEYEQAKGESWWLRQDIIWHKPNPMPESVTDRCSKAHEYVFLLSKSARYFYDHEAVKEESSESSGWAKQRARGENTWEYNDTDSRISQTGQRIEASTFGTAGSRNRRSVWTISTRPYSGAHFATFPPDLIEPMVLAGTSEHGACSVCGAPWERVTENGEFVPMRWAPGDDKTQQAQRAVSGAAEPSSTSAMVRGGVNQKMTTGWRATCEHTDAPVVPCIVLDPFGGAGTTGLVADRLGRDAILIELNPDYANMARQRIVGDAPMFANVVMEGER